MNLGRYYRLRMVRIFGAPVSVHWSVLVATAVLAVSALRSPIYAIAAISSYLGILLVHETGHAFVARRLHLDVLSIKIGVIHGLCEYEAPENTWDETLVSWGGVLAQVCVGVLVFLAVALLRPSKLGYAGPVVVFLGYINLMVAAVNLAPTPGLDGYKAWRIVPLVVQRIRAKRAASQIVGRAKNAR